MTHFTEVLAQAIRTNPRTLGAGELAERYIKALYDAGYVVIKDRNDPEGGIPGRSQRHSQQEFD